MVVTGEMHPTWTYVFNLESRLPSQLKRKNRSCPRSLSTKERRGENGTPLNSDQVGEFLWHISVLVQNEKKEDTNP